MTGSRATRFLAGITVLLVLSWAMAGCGKKPAAAGQLIVGIAAEPERFDPLTMKNPQSFIASWQVFEGLFTLDEKGQIAGSLAESWETANNVVWRIRLRQAVQFHPSEVFGAPGRSRSLEAADVVASYTAFCSAGAYAAFLLTDTVAGCADYNAGKATAVSGVRMIDAATVEIELIKPEPHFLNRLTTAWIAIFPRELLEPRFESTRGLSVVIGTGPFRVVSRTASEVVMERNEAYWAKGGQGVVNRLVYRVVSNDQVRLAELRKGGIDLMIVPPSLYPAAFDPNGSLKTDIRQGLRSHGYATINSHMIGINNARVSDVHLRRAMNHAVNRRQIVDRLLYGQGEPMVGTVPAGTRGYIAPFDVDATFDLTLARAELKRSNYRGESIEMLVHEQAGSEQIGQIFSEQMRAIGVNINLVKVDFNSAIGRMIGGNTQLFSMYLDYVYSAPEGILMAVFPSEKRPAPNFWQFSNTEADAALEGLRSPAPNEANQKAANVERLVMEQVPALFLFRARQTVLYSERFGDLIVNQHGHFAFDRLGAASK